MTAALLVACSEDPTASLAGDPARVVLAFNYLEVDVDASAVVDAVVRDGSGTPLNIPVTVTSSNTAIVTVSAAQDPPHVLTRVTVRGASIGTANVIATAAGLEDTLEVATFAAALEVTPVGPNPGTLVSGLTKSFSYAYTSASGRDLTAQVAPPTWSVDEATRATVNPATGDITGKDFGSVLVTATGPGASENGLTGSASVFVNPAAFLGAVTPDPANPSGVITITPGTGPAFDTDTRVFFNRAEVPADATNADGDSVVSVTPTAIQVFLGDLRRPGNVELVLAGVGASQLSVGTGPTAADSLAVQLPVLAGTVTPDPVDPGAVLTISAGGGPAFDPDTRVYLNGVRVPTAATAPERIVSLTPAAITVQTNDLRSGGRLELLLTRVGAGQAAQADSFDVSAPAAFTGTLSANGGTPAQIITITQAAGGPAFDADARVFFDGIEAFIAQPVTFPATAINVAVPVIDQIAQVELRMTRLGAAQESEKVAFTSTTKSYLDPFDAVNNDPGTAPLLTANGDYFVVLFGGCLSGVGTGGADCDDFFKIRNSGGAPAVVTVNVRWSGGADIDAFGLDPTFDFCTYDGGCAAATGANPEQFTMTIPAGQTWFIYLNHWDFHGVPHSLTRVRVSGLP